MFCCRLASSAKRAVKAAAKTAAKYGKEGSAIFSWGFHPDRNKPWQSMGARENVKQPLVRVKKLVHP